MRNKELSTEDLTDQSELFPAGSLFRNITLGMVGMCKYDKIDVYVKKKTVNGNVLSTVYCCLL